jgi:hypothetical protein
VNGITPARKKPKLPTAAAFMAKCIQCAALLLLFTSVFAMGQNRGLRLARNGSHLSVDNSPSLEQLQAFTLEGYVSFEPGGTENPRIFSKGWEANDGLEFGLNGTGSARQLFVDCGSVDAILSKGALQSNRWYHVAIAYGAGSGFFAINGQLDSSFTRVLRATNNFPINLGRNSGTGRDQLLGYLDEFRVWNRKLTLTEIRSNIYSALKGDESGLVAYWNFDGGTGNDLSPFANNGVLVSGTIEPIALTLVEAVNIFTAVEIMVQAPPGRTIQLQSSTNLTDWADFGAPIQGTGIPVFQLVSTRFNSVVFYRQKP